MYCGVKNVTRIILVLSLVLAGCFLSSPFVAAESTGDQEAQLHVTASDLAVTVLPAAEVEWQALNPARGDASPRAATLWGDRKANEASGFLVRFVDGFSSPPHIHNVSYRGVVIRGLVHNDDASAPVMWMPAGSYWTQPKGAPHITSSKGSSIAYIEIDEGPYLVHPVDGAFESEERPINVDATNLVWVDALSGRDIRTAYLWGSPDDGLPSGRLLRIRSGSSVKVAGAGRLVRAVLVRGVLAHPFKNDETLEPGSLVSTNGSHRLFCVGSGDCVLYLRAEAKFLLRS